MADKDFSTYNNSYKSCNSAIAKNCDDYQECYNGSTYHENTPMCCSAYESCKLTTNITTSIDLNGSNVYNTGFRADGYYSSDDMSGTIFAQNGGNIYLAGAHANSDSRSTYKTTIKTNGNWDIISSGYFAAGYKILTQARNVYCIAMYACIDATISSIEGMVFVGGDVGAYGASLNDIGGSVYCAGDQFCYRTTMTNISENVVGLGERCLYNSNFYNINGTVAGYGYRSLYSAYVDNVVNVCPYLS